MLPRFGLLGPSKFEFIPGQTPLSTWNEVLVGCALYLGVIFGIQHFMKSTDSKPIPLRMVFVAHNLALVAVSAVLLYETMRVVLGMWFGKGLNFAMCSKEAFGGGLEFWYYRGLK
jgi:hypothetical protein